ncbi:MAG: 4'-phosphopantetheinyl transferase superfamily protein [Terrimicrobiaceae bacterium]|nr:4'-phosphopantetheinyl transferase superfamily protein [Terrimicrobiaceae bacterium]
MTEANFVKAGKSPIRPSGNTVHVWRIRSAEPSWMSEAEAAAAARIPAAPVQSTFVKSRAGLRRILAGYLGCDLHDVEVERPLNGKPRLMDGELFFNVSHSGSEICAAFSAAEIGIDIERSDRRVDAIALAHRYFLPEEASRISASGNPLADFLQTWVVKEAAVKLSGEGLATAIGAVQTLGTVRLQGRPIVCERFRYEGVVGCIAAFEDFEVKGWFDL